MIGVKVSLNLICLALLLATHLDLALSIPKQKGMDMVHPQSTDVSPEQAEDSLRQHIAQIPFLQDASIVRVPDLDIDGLYAFSVMPQATGRAGEVIYLVDANHILSSGQPKDFDYLMNRLGVGTMPDVLDVHRFAHLFLRLRALQSGVVLDSPGGHVLLRPEQLSEAQFSLPQSSFGEEGCHYSFWMFDTDRLEPIFWDVLVAPDGTTSFSHSG